MVCNHSGRSHNNLTILHYSQGQEKLFLTFRLTHNEPQDQNRSFLFNSDLLPSERPWKIMTKKSQGKVVWTNVKTICTRGFFFFSPITFYVLAVFPKNKVMYIVRYSGFFVFELNFWNIQYQNCVCSTYWFINLLYYSWGWSLNTGLSVYCHHHVFTVSPIFSLIFF